ncbi:MAG TPA: hypothetical protein VFE10_06420 [Phenylobacterium sp.]|jgi:hypothetical protein|nr:hypothetical protein [Phenylobacterium sp.]
MSKLLSIPVSRLICLGGAKLSTNANLTGEQEGQPNDGFGA